MLKRSSEVVERVMGRIVGRYTVGEWNIISSGVVVLVFIYWSLATNL